MGMEVLRRGYPLLRTDKIPKTWCARKPSSSHVPHLGAPADPKSERDGRWSRPGPPATVQVGPPGPRRVGEAPPTGEQDALPRSGQHEAGSNGLARGVEFVL